MSWTMAKWSRQHLIAFWLRSQHWCLQLVRNFQFILFFQADYSKAIHSMKAIEYKGIQQHPNRWWGIRCVLCACVSLLTNRMMRYLQQTNPPQPPPFDPIRIISVIIINRVSCQSIMGISKNRANSSFIDRSPIKFCAVESANWNQPQTGLATKRRCVPKYLRNPEWTKKLHTITPRIANK